MMKFQFKLVLLLYICSYPALAMNCMQAEWKRGKPFNYYAAETRQSTGSFRGGLLYLVEKEHFTKEVRTLTGGHTGSLPKDLDFVLNSIPNHPAALDAYAKYEFYYKTMATFRELRTNKRPTYQAECLFNRAISLFPKHADTYIVWGMHYTRQSKYSLAVEKYLMALELDNKNANTHYNLGLAYLNLDKIGLAKKHAELAYSLGYPLEGLRNKIALLEQPKGS